MRFIGIDPGNSGGIAVLDESGRVLMTTKMPETDGDLFDYLEQCKAPVGEETKAFIEKVHAGIFGGKGKMGVVSAFTFGGSYRAAKMAMVGNKIAFEEVTPQKWQQALACLTKGDKNISKQRAQELFPDLRKVTHAFADALLIAEYGRRLEVRC